MGAYYYNDVAGPGLVYVFTRDGQTWTERQALKASDSRPTDGFGRSVAHAGTSLLVGGNDAVYVFASGADGRAERQRLPLQHPVDVAISGDDVAIALGGHVLVRRAGAFQVVPPVDLSDKPLELDVWRVQGREMYAPRAVAADGETRAVGGRARLVVVVGSRP